MAEKEFTVSSLDREELLALIRKAIFFLPLYSELLSAKWEVATNREAQAHRRASELRRAEFAAFDVCLCVNRKGSVKARLKAVQEHLQARTATEKAERAATRASAEADRLWKLLDACDHLRRAQMGGEDHD